MAWAQAAQGDQAGSQQTLLEYELRAETTSKLLELPARYAVLIANLYSPNGTEVNQAKWLVQTAREREFSLMELRSLHALALCQEGGLTSEELARAQYLTPRVDSPLAPHLLASCVHIGAGQDRATGPAARALARRGLMIPLGHAISGLTAREQQLAELLALGFSNAQIAKRLVISRRTVESHVARIMQKLNVASRDDVSDALERHG